MGIDSRSPIFFLLCFVLLSDLRLSELCNVFRHARFSSIHLVWDHSSVYLSLLRQQPWSPLQVPWRLQLHRCRIPRAFQPSVQHLLLAGCGTTGNSRTAHDLCARASGEVHFAPDPQFTIVSSLSSTVLGCGHPWVLYECLGQIVVKMSCGHPYKAS